MASPDLPDPFGTLTDRLLAGLPPAWGNAPVSQDQETAPVLLVKALFYRNFSGLPFVVSAPPNACALAADRALDFIAAQGGLAVRRLGDCPPRAIRLLREREILPQRAVAFPGKKGFKYLATAPDAASWILVNEVEHLTTGRLFPGCPSPEGLAALHAPPREDARMPWAWSGDFGYLASDPSRLGPGLSLEWVVHLPGLALSRQLPHARNYLAAAGCGFLPVSAPHPSDPATAAADAGMFRLSFRGRLGQTLPEIHADFLGAVRLVLRRELEARRRCSEKHHKRLEERAHRALRTLAEASALAYPELAAQASIIRMAAWLGMLSPQIPGILEELRVTAGSGHLAVTSGRDLSKEEEDFARANVVRLSLLKHSGEIA